VSQLMAMFLRGSQSAPVGWYFTGIGLRKMQDLGAHQSKLYSRTQPSGSFLRFKVSPDANLLTVQEELWKRAFWLLVAFDRVGSVSLGRPCCIGEEE
jgi:hypothetical protein